MRHPKNSIPKGYDIHVVFQDNQREEARLLFDSCIEFLINDDITFQNHKVFSSPVGPWPTPMWQFVLPSSPQVHHDLGLCISWFMLNRGELSVMIHPNSRKENELGGAYEDHVQNHLWLGQSMSLKIEIFKDSTHN